MRWPIKKPEPVIPLQAGAIRVYEKFFYLPLTLPVGSKDGCLEGRWWEKVKVTQELYEAANSDWHVYRWWVDLYFTE